MSGCRPRGPCSRPATPENLPLLEEAMAAEVGECKPDPAGHARGLGRDRCPAQRCLARPTYAEAVDIIAARGDRQALGVLNGRACQRRPEGSQARRSSPGISAIQRPPSPADVGQKSGTASRWARCCSWPRSGLAITFGVMGVNQHGAWRDGDDRRLHHLRGAEHVRASAPETLRLFARLRTAAGLPREGLVGIGIERGIIRWL